MKTEQVTVFCSRPFRFAHNHPAPDFDCVKDRPYLGSTHEHQAVVKVWARSKGFERGIDLLPLQAKLEKVICAPLVMQFNAMSFEAIARWFYDMMSEGVYTSICAVEITADGVEGALVTWGQV